MENKKICRLCMSPSLVYHSLLTDDAIDKILSLTALQIKDDEDLPTVACVKCWLNVKFAYRVQQTILETDRKLRDVAKNQKTDVEKVVFLKSESKEIVDIQDEFESKEFRELQSPIEPCEVIVIKNEDNFELNEASQQTVSQELIESFENSAKTANIILDNSQTKCAICGDNISDNSMPGHIRDHFFSEQTCECGEIFDNITLYQEHFAKEHSDTESQTWTCETCFLTFKYKSLYNLHIQSAHQHKLVILREKVYADEPNTPVITPSPKKTKPRTSTNRSSSGNNKNEIFKCDECLKQFTSEQQYFTHLKQHERKKCPICQAEITRYNFNKHVTMHSAGPSICHLCGVTCKNFDSLRGHLYYTHSKNTFPCEICGQTFKKKYSRLMHIKKEHTGEKNYTCETCGKAFFTNYYLMKHIKMTHLKLRPHVCEHCNKGFSSKFALKTHVRQHTNDAPYKCEICGEGFRQNVSLRAHKRSKHNIVEEKTCKCKVCGKAFASEWAVKSHSRLHY